MFNNSNCVKTLVTQCHFLHAWLLVPRICSLLSRPGSHLSNAIKQLIRWLFYPWSRGEFSFWHLKVEAVSIWQCVWGAPEAGSICTSYMWSMLEWCKPWKYCTTHHAHINKDLAQLQQTFKVVEKERLDTSVNLTHTHGKTPGEQVIMMNPSPPMCACVC